jgi:hypothetical protein
MAALALLVTAPPVLGQSAPPPTFIAGGRSTIIGAGEFHLGGQAGHSEGGHSVAPTTGPPPTILDPQLRTAPDGSVCVYVGRQPGDPNSLLAVQMEIRSSQLVANHPLCPGSPPAPGRISPAAAASEVWHDQVDLQDPTLRMAPGKAITGLEGCLEIAGPQSVSRDFPNVFGYDIHIDATSTYDVDWGDGTWTHGLSTQGGPCPGGTIRHTYTTKGTATIVVYQTWQATWSAGGPPAPIPGQLETTASLTLPIEEVQAVGQ